MKTPQALASWIAQLLAVAVLGQTLYFKFSGHPETLALFAELDMPSGPVVIGLLELAACLLLLIPASAVYGALLGAGLMTGALIAHATRLGWEGERGLLGGLAALTLAACAAVMFLRRSQLPFLKTALSEEEPCDRE